MNPDVQKNLKYIVLAAGVIILFMLLSILTVWLQKRSIEKQVQQKFDNLLLPKPIIIEKYDSTTQAKLEDISVSRQIAHKRINDLHDAALQHALDSVFNSPR